MLETVGRGFRRVGIVLGIAVVFVALLSAVVTVIPRSLLPFYLGGWLLLFVGMSLEYAEIPQVRRLANSEPVASFLTVAEILAIFLFGLVAFRSLFGANPMAAAAALLGIVVAFYEVTV